MITNNIGIAKNENVFLLIDNKIERYTLYYIERYYNRKFKAEYNTIISSNLLRLIQDKNCPLIDFNTKVPKGKSIYVSPDCPIPIADLRKHYNIKRFADSGEYNVLNFKPTGRCIYNYMIFEQEKIIIGKNYPLNLDLDKILAIISKDSGMKLSAANGVKNGALECAFLPDKASVFRKLFNSELKLPVVTCEQLDTRNENKLTVDTLMTIYESCKRTYDPNIIRPQLMLLNQYDWENYPYTMYTLFKAIGVKNKTSGVTDKAIIRMKDKCEYRPTIIEEQDRLLLAEFMSKLLNINGTMYVDYLDVLDKTYSQHIDIRDFCKVFQCIVRIKI